MEEGRRSPQSQHTPDVEKGEEERGRGGKGGDDGEVEEEGGKGGTEEGEDAVELHRTGSRERGWERRGKKEEEGGTKGPLMEEGPVKAFHRWAKEDIRKGEKERKD